MLSWFTGNLGPTFHPQSFTDILWLALLFPCLHFFRGGGSAFYRQPGFFFFLRETEAQTGPVMGNEAALYEHMCAHTSTQEPILSLQGLSKFSVRIARILDFLFFRRPSMS